MLKRSLLLLPLLLWACSNQLPTVPRAKQARELSTIVALGDSLTAGLGVLPEESYPALLEKRLQQEGYSYRVVNAGISGETSSGTLSRLDWVLKTLQPEIVILIIGGNDGLRGTSPELLRSNLETIITRLEHQGIIVVLGGMRMLPNLGPDYVSRFEAVYPDISQSHDVIFVPFALEGVAGQRELMQVDGIHPNPQGYVQMAENLYPAVKKAIKRQAARPK